MWLVTTLMCVRVKHTELGRNGVKLRMSNLIGPFYIDYMLKLCHMKSVMVICFTYFFLSFSCFFQY
jgi:hypothetical protein